MKLNIKLLLVLGICTIGFVTTWGQGNQAFEKIVLIKNTDFQKDIMGYKLRKTHAPQHGDYSSSGNVPNYTLTYSPDSGYVGIDTLIVEYWERSRRRGTHYYESFVFEMVESVVLPTTDYFTMYKNDSAFVMDVLSNDSTNIGAVLVEYLPNTNNGQCITLPDGNLEFTPNDGFVGMAYVNYVACDSLGACGNGLVMISVVDSTISNESDTINLITDIDVSTTFGLALSNMTLVDSPAYGLINNLTASVIEFVPNPGYSGKDTFLLESGNVSQLFYVDVLDKPVMNGVLVDDVIQCAMNNAISFDVLSNDVTDNYSVKIKQYPAQGNLVHDTLGEYTYTPPSDYQGIQYFKYELKYSSIGEIAEVAIYINDGHPQNERTYDVYVPYVNVPYVLNYDIPIKDFDDFYLDSISGGTLNIYNGQDTVPTNYCDTIIGEDLIVYTSPHNSGGDYFVRLKHCTSDSNDCELVNINIHVKPVLEPNCACSNDCVWQGDINYDGKVNMKDLLSLGYLIGESGPARSNNGQVWEPQSSSIWGQKILGSERDIKHADTDGDGLISSSDTTSISEFYYKEHSMEPELVGPERDFPFYLIPLFDSVQAGDLAVYEIALGDEIDPAFDLHGFAYTLTFGFEYDSSSLNVEPIPSTWFTGNAGFLDLAKQPIYQQVDGGMTRTSGNLASGLGSVETLDFIVEENVEGFKYGAKRLAIEIIGFGVGASGEIYQLPGDIAYLPLAKKQNREIRLNPRDMLVYPNPTAGVINLHLNGGNIMKSAYIYDINGRYLNEVKLDSPTHTQVDLSHLYNGIYIIRINTPFGPISKRLEVVR